MIYSAFGLSLAADWPIPGLPPPSPSSSADISVRLDTSLDTGAGEVLYYGSDDEGGGVPALQVWSRAGHYRLRYADGTQFLVDRSGREVRVVVAPESTLEDAATYLLGPVIGFAMRLRGITCLHASVVAVGGEAIVIAGPAGAGKSTTAASFSAMGYPILSDDIAALSERGGNIHVQPAYPQIRLWPDSVAMLYGVPDALPRLTPTWDKRGLLLSEPQAFQQESLPLGAVYVLGDTCAVSEPLIETISGSACLLALLANTYVGYLLDRTMRHQEFQSLARLGSFAPVRRIVRPAAYAPAAICARILEDCQRLRPATVAGQRHG